MRGTYPRTPMVNKKVVSTMGSVGTSIWLLTGFEGGVWNSLDPTSDTKSVKNKTRSS